VGRLVVVERLRATATTDFGDPGRAPSVDVTDRVTRPSGSEGELCYLECSPNPQMRPTGRGGPGPERRGAPRGRRGSVNLYGPCS
jgi:hypothetical protein